MMNTQHSPSPIRKMLIRSCRNGQLAFLLLIGTGIAIAQSSDLGLFTDQSSIGQTPPGSTAHYDPAKSEYRITGGGANVWGTSDAFYFVWRKASGDITLTADAVSHGNGLTSLQFRGAANEQTYQIPTQVDGTVRLRIERKGSRFIMYAGKPNEELKMVGPVEYVGLKDPVYLGLGVCSHVATTLETAVFSNVKIEETPAPK
jgi:hypothetical protein